MISRLCSPQCQPLNFIAVTEAGYEQAYDGLLAVFPVATWPEITGHVHLDFASGHGLPTIGELLPDSWQLPFDVVTIPHTASDLLPA